MTSRLRLTSAAIVSAALALYATVAGTALAQISRPATAAVHPVQDTYFGTTVTDNYRWLEDQKSPESKQWMKSQADYTRTTLDSLSGRAAFAAEMTRYMNAADYTIANPQRAGGLLFYRKRMRGENQASLYVRHAGQQDERKLFDPEALSTPGHHRTLDSYAPAHSGKYVVLGVSAGGSEEKTGYILDVATGRELPDKLPKYEGGTFLNNDTDVYYAALETLAPGAPPIDKFRRPRMLVHRLGQPTGSDTLLLAQGLSPQITIPDYSFPYAGPSPDSPYALAVVAPGVETYQRVYVGKPEALTTHTGWHTVAELKDRVTDVALMGSDLYLVCFNDTLNGKILRVDAAAPDITRAEVVMPASDLVLSGGFIGQDSIHAAKDGLYIQVIDKGYGRLYRIPYGKGQHATAVPTPAGLAVAGTVTDTTTPGAVVDLTSWIDNGDFYEYQPKTMS